MNGKLSFAKLFCNRDLLRKKDKIAQSVRIIKEKCLHINAIIEQTL